MRIVQQLVIATAVLILPVNVFGQDAERIFYVKVTKETTQLSGQLIELDALKVATAFGNVTIPLEKIEAVRMRADSEERSVIALGNGDMITGKIEIDELHLKTNWGKAHINSVSLESFSVSPYGRFYTDPTQGGWRYSRGSAATGQQQQNNQLQNNQQGSSNRFGNN